jgi:hypothetical protein
LNLSLTLSTRVPFRATWKNGVWSKFCYDLWIEKEPISNNHLEDLELIIDLPNGLRKSGAIEIRKIFGTISGGGRSRCWDAER